MLSFLITLPLMLVLLYVIYRCIAYYCDRDDSIPHLPPEIIFGNLRQTKELKGEARCTVWSQFQKQYGDIFAYYYFYERLIVLSKPEDAQYIFKNRDIYAMPRAVEQIFRIFTRSGLISTNEEKYKHHARIMLPLWSHTKVLNHFDTIIQCTDRLIAKWQSKYDERNKFCITVVDDVRQLATGIMLLILFGDTCSSSSYLFNSLISAANICVEFIYRAIHIPLFCTNLYLKYSPTCKKYREAINLLTTYSYQMVDERIEPKGQLTSEVENRSLLSSILCSSLLNDNDCDTQAKLSKSDVVDEMIMFVLAAQESPTSALSWFIFIISKHPHIQQKIKNELKSHSIYRSTVLTTEILDKLEYCDCVIKELIRYSPISGPCVRTPVQDDIINGIKVRKSDTILIPTSNMHHDPRYWNIEPSLFYPERFLNEDKNHHPFAYLPFGSGPLMCPGKRLARFELKVIIVRLMQFITFIDSGEENGNTGGYLQKLICLPKSIAVHMDFDD